MKYYKTNNGVAIHSNEKFFRVLRYSLAFVAFILIAVLLKNELVGIDWVYLTTLILFIVTMVIIRLTIEVDIKNSKYRQGFKIFGLSMGSWVAVKEVSYISIFPTLGSKERAVPIATGAIISDIQMKELRVNLVVNNRNRIMLQSELATKQAQSLALELAEELNLGVYDCTGKENVWLKPR